MRTALTVTAALFLTVRPVCFAAPLPVVAAENFYGDVASQVGGQYVGVVSILANPNQDPHLFTASPSVARAVSSARFVVYNGLDYDPWMSKLLDAAPSSNRQTLVVGRLVGKQSGDNPHIWYSPRTMLVLAQTLAGAFSAADSPHANAYEQQLAQFEMSLKPILSKIAFLRSRYAGTPVTATEPIFGYMFDALGMTVRNRSFQISVMNNTEPVPSDVVGFENDLKSHKVRLLIYNRQASDPMADRMKALAKAATIPVVGAAETEPAGMQYQQWMLNELDAVDHALAGATTQ